MPANRSLGNGNGFRVKHTKVVSKRVNESEVIRVCILVVASLSHGMVDEATSHEGSCSRNLKFVIEN